MPNASDKVPKSVFILGAGFSKAISQKMPVLQELSAAIASRVAQSDVISSTPYLAEDVELAMTFLAGPQPWMSEAQRLRNRAAFLELTEAIGAEITHRSALVRSCCIPGWLLRFVHWLHFRKATVITLNYDTLLENAIMQIPGGDCSPKHLIPFRFAADEGVASGGDVHANSMELLKLHGSVNWRYSGRTAYAGELIQWSGVNGWDNQAQGVWRMAKTADTVPLLIPPVADKTGYFMHHSLQHLWKRAHSALASAKQVFCVGYSLPITDLTMRFLLSGVDRESPADFYLVNRPDAVKRYKSVLPETLFRLNERFIGADPVEPFVAELFSDEFFPDYTNPVTQCPGPVETAVRDHVAVGISFPAAKNAGTWVVNKITANSLTLLLDAAEIPVRLPWSCLEESLVELQKAQLQRLDIDQFGLDLSAALRAHCDRNLGPWIAALLEKAGVATVWYCVNRWVVSPAGANAEEIARSRMGAHA